MGVVGAYTFVNRAALGVALVLAIFGASAVLSVLNTITAELFEDDERGDAFAWSNNLLGRFGYVLSPIVAGHLAATWGFGPAVALTALPLLVALMLLLVWPPETAGKSLDETARLGL